MTKLFVVAIRDRAVDGFMQPGFVPALGLAVRQFQDELNREDRANPLWAHPEDYDLYLLASYDDSAGTFTVGDEKLPKMIAVGKDLSSRLKAN